MKEYIKWFVIVLLSFMAAWYVSTYKYQFMLIQGESMEPSYHNMQPVILEKDFSEITAGDVVACKCEALDAILVKRVVAVPGDTVSIAEGVLYVNGKPSAHQRPDARITYAGIAEESILLGPEEYFLLGDNYEYSKDSRYEEINVMKENAIIGKIL